MRIIRWQEPEAPREQTLWKRMQTPHHPGQAQGPCHHRDPAPCPYT